ncbi:enoyl-CoA hydratase-related protein, partial [Chloroflexota bacterium]
MAKLIATKGTLAVNNAKKALNRGLNMTLIQGLELERDYFNELMASEDKMEGTTAFMEKRKPVFKGK